MNFMCVFLLPSPPLRTFKNNFRIKEKSRNGTGTVEAFSFSQIVFLFVHSYILLLPPLRHCSECKRCKEEATCVYCHNHLKKSLDCNVLVFQKEKWGLKKIETAQKKESVIPGVGRTSWKERLRENLTSFRGLREFTMQARAAVQTEERAQTKRTNS